MIGVCEPLTWTVETDPRENRQVATQVLAWGAREYTNRTTLCIFFLAHCGSARYSKLYALLNFTFYTTVGVESLAIIPF